MLRNIVGSNRVASLVSRDFLPFTGSIVPGGLVTLYSLAFHDQNKQSAPDDPSKVRLMSVTMGLKFSHVVAQPASVEIELWIADLDASRDALSVRGVDPAKIVTAYTSEPLPGVKVPFAEGSQTWSASDSNAGMSDSYLVVVPIGCTIFSRIKIHHNGIGPGNIDVELNAYANSIEIQPSFIK